MKGCVARAMFFTECMFAKMSKTHSYLTINVCLETVDHYSYIVVSILCSVYIQRHVLKSVTLLLPLPVKAVY